MAFALLSLVAAHTPASGREEQREPYDLVRELRMVQDRIAQGSAEARAAQKDLLERLTEQLAHRSPEVWKEPKNARAAVVFVLSGGDARLLRKALNAGELPAPQEALVRGAVAYGEGRSEEALKFLSHVDPRALDASLGGHIALIMGELLVRKDPPKALAFLDEARLLSPGTLIEEAALRRQVSLLANVGNYQRFELLAASYLRRFPRSFYAASFRRQLASDVMTRGPDPAWAARLDAIIGGLERKERAEIYLLMAREALSKGYVEWTRLAAEKAGRLLAADSVEARRARLYDAAALVVTSRLEEGVAALEALNPAELGEEHSELRDAALAVAAEVRRSPSPAEAEGELPIEERPAPVEAAARARQVMARVDKLLAEAGKR
jgi:chemotaxis protein MotC